MDEEIVHTLFSGISVGGLPVAAAELATTAQTVLHVARRFIEFTKRHS